MEFASNRPRYPRRLMTPIRADERKEFFVTDTDALQRLERLAMAAGATEIAAEAAALARHAAEGRFYLACVGQFKRGKSSLINSLLGTSILPTGVVPVTSVPTVVRYGEEGARVRQDGRWRAIAPQTLVDYVSQERNPGNVKGVVGLEVFLPRELLRDGLCFVDTPGLGSVFDVNTASTLEFLPHIDAALLVVGADPPISGDERRFAADLASQTETLLCVLTRPIASPTISGPRRWGSPGQFSRRRSAVPSIRSTR